MELGQLEGKYLDYDFYEGSQAVIYHHDVSDANEKSWQRCKDRAESGIELLWWTEDQEILSWAKYWRRQEVQSVERQVAFTVASSQNEKGKWNSYHFQDMQMQGLQRKSP